MRFFTAIVCFTLAQAEPTWKLDQILCDGDWCAKLEECGKPADKVVPRAKAEACAKAGKGKRLVAELSHVAFPTTGDFDQNRIPFDGISELLYSGSEPLPVLETVLKTLDVKPKITGAECKIKYLTSTGEEYAELKDLIGSMVTDYVQIVPIDKDGKASDKCTVTVPQNGAKAEARSVIRDYDGDTFSGPITCNQAWCKIEACGLKAGSANGGAVTSEAKCLAAAANETQYLEQELQANRIAGLVENNASPTVKLDLTGLVAAGSTRITRVYFKPVGGSLSQNGTLIKLCQTLTINSAKKAITDKGKFTDKSFVVKADGWDVEVTGKNGDAECAVGLAVEKILKLTAVVTKEGKLVVSGASGFALVGVAAALVLSALSQ